MFDDEKFGTTEQDSPGVAGVGFEPFGSRPGGWPGSLIDQLTRFVNVDSDHGRISSSPRRMT
jgi:hypothetical protein